LTKKPSASQIVPVELQHRLQQHAHQSDLSSWIIGDIAVILEDEYTIAKVDGTITHTVPLHELHAAIGQFASRSSETIRDYGYTSRRVTQDLRDEFDMLGRHHHKAIADIAKGNEAKHRELCAKWLEKADDYGGQIGSVGALRLWLKHGRKAPAAWESRLERARGLCARLEADDAAPPKVRAAAAAFGRAVG
jgi:hypothetical protein